MLMLLSEHDLSDSQEVKIQTKTRQREEKNYWARIYSILVGYIMSKEFVALVLTLIIYYAVFVTSITKTNKASPAQLFFTNSSCLRDYFDGDLGVAMKHALTSEISAVLLYAPWDTDSHNARHAYDLTCRFHSKQIKFLAINCWHPGSTCRTHFTKLNRFPVLLVYIQSGLNAQTGSSLHVIQYKGHLDPDYMINFLNNILSPVYKIDSEADLASVRSSNEGLIVLCSDINSNLYKTFYSVALKFLEYDPNRDVKFAAVLNQRTAKAVTQSWPALVLYNFNNASNYKGKFTEEKIIEWILGSLGPKPVNWINLSGSKSVTLNYYLKNETSLVLFTPRHLLRNINIYYNLLKVVSAEFHKSCQSNTSPSSDLKEKYQVLINYLVVNNIIEVANDKLLTDTCRELKMKIIQKIIDRRRLMERWQLKNSLAKRVERPRGYSNESFESNVDVGNSFGYVLNVNKATGILFSINSRPVEDLFNASTFVTSENYLPVASRIISPITFIDKYSIVNLLYENSKQMCKILRLAQRIVPSPEITELHSGATGEWGNAFADCTTNKTLNFLSVDSKRHRYFLENLNIDLSSYKDETLALIVDAGDNSDDIYLLTANITRDSLVLFVKDFLGDRLTRYKRNNDISPPIGAGVTKPILSLNRKFDRSVENSTIHELNSATFYSVTHNSSSNVLVLFYSKYCAHCLSYSHVFLLFSHILSHIRQLRFTRIDADTNDLSYPFIPIGFPALLLFPVEHPEDSISYDRSEPLTQSNFLAFLLREISDVALRIQIYLSACLQINTGHTFECLSYVNKLLHGYISRDKLKVYKTYARFHSLPSIPNSYNLTVKLKKYLVRLKHLRSVQLVVRNQLLVSSTRKNRQKVTRFLSYLYSLYVKCDIQVAHINRVYAHLSNSKSANSNRKYRLKEEL